MLMGGDNCRTENGIDQHQLWAGDVSFDDRLPSSRLIASVQREVRVS